MMVAGVQYRDILTDQNTNHQNKRNENTQKQGNKLNLRRCLQCNTIYK